MPWTPEQKLDALMKLPWTVVSGRNEEDGYYVARVAELEGVLATGATLKELGRDLWESLRSGLACRLEFDDDIPLPAGIRAPWELMAAPAAVQQEEMALGQQGLAASTGAEAAATTSAVLVAA
jgi:predicted RNase H-like HicB family nuclease